MERNFFTVKTTKSKEYPVIVYSLNYTTLSDYILLVQEELIKKSYEGIVLFDLLQSNGINDRYYIIPFDGSKFEYKKITNKISLPLEIVNVSNNFYKKNNAILENGILNNVQRLRLKEEYTI